MTSESPLSPGNVEASNPEPEVRYVLSGQPTGWAAMGKEVREFDEEKIRNSKEDIDTLLVFAGLFSAVLSAFVVAAYPSLQPDRMDTVVYTLQVIAAQTAGYHLIGNAVTSSPASLPPLPAFKPASNDIRVNILWFASLVISLVTASFAMLVKQWLREFLAVDVPSPQARLRIRHFREPQLRKWMVFEIAASLPLLLQLSLGLFFVGLCYFTAAIHANIGYTTLPLVIGWALFFFTVSALPIFFPRCPYGNTLLKAVVTQLHRRIKLLVRWARSRSQSDSAYPESSFFFNGLYRAWSSCCALLKSVLQHTLPDEKHLPDEREIVKAQDQDINILVSVDAIQANDELLVTAMAEAFHYCQPDWKDAVGFVVQVLAHRLPTVAESDRVLFEWPFYGASPLLSLRPRVLECIAKILSESANHLPFGYKSIFLINPPNDGGHGRIEYQRTESVHLLCMFSLTVAAASVSIQSITSNPGLLGFLQQLFDRSEYSGVLQLSKDWLQVAMGKHSTQLNGLPPSPTTLPQAVGSLLRVVTELVEPAKISLTKGVELVEALTETKIDTWGQTVEWTTLASGHILHSTVVEIYLQALLHGEFQHRIRIATDSESESSMTYSSSTSPAETGRVLRAILRAMLHKESNNVARYFRQRTSLCCLSRIVELAARDESCTEYLLDVLLDRSGPDGHPNSITLTRLHTSGMNRRIWDALYRFERSDITTQGVGFFKKSILSRCSRNSGEGALLPLLQLCQTAMVPFSLVNIATDGRAAVREIFASFVTPLRLQVGLTQNSGIQLNAAIDENDPPDRHLVPSTTYIAELAHACLRTMELFQHNRYIHHEKKWPQFSEPDSIFPDDLVEILMELDITEPREPVRSFFRVRRIEKKKARLALQRAQEIEADASDQGHSDQGNHDLVERDVREPEGAGRSAHRVKESEDVHGSSNTGRDVITALPTSSHSSEGTPEGELTQVPDDDDTSITQPV